VKMLETDFSRKPVRVISGPKLLCGRRHAYSPAPMKPQPITSESGAPRRLVSTLTAVTRGCVCGYLSAGEAHTTTTHEETTPMMEHRTLGRSGCAVSAFALGTMTFGRETDEDDSHAQLDAFFAAGGTLIDTADVYGRGASEEIIGRWLAKQPAEIRSQVVLATKGRFAMGEGRNDLGLSRRHLRDALDASLRRLGVDSVDLYQVHAFDAYTPLEETLRFLDDAVRAGKISYVGLSNYTGWQVQKVVDLADFRGLARPVTLQPQYNLLVREIEWEIVPACESTGLGLLPWSPLGGGWLTGKYRKEERPSGATRLGENPDRGVEAYHRRSPQQRTWDVIDAVETVAEGRGASMAQVALAWLVDRPMMTSVILGARTLEQLQDNLGAAGLHLSEEETAQLDAASDPAPADYPYGGPGVEQRGRVI
jgi:aryl-alcohol dehydrogenase-like predicted oxidoreductase